MTEGTISRLFTGLAAALFAAAGPLLVSRATAGDDDPPAVRPDSPDDAVRARVNRGPVSSVPADALRWGREVAAAGRVRLGTVLGGDALYEAGMAAMRLGNEPSTGRQWLKEAVAAYPPGSVGIGHAWLGIAEAQTWLNDPAVLLDALDRAEAVAAMPEPADATARRHWRELRDNLPWRIPELRTRALTGLSRHAEAAAVFEALADSPAAARGGHTPEGWWADAAAAAWRAKDRPRAMADAEKALALSSKDEDVVSNTTWLLLARYGLISEAGEIELSNQWPGAAFLDDARVAAKSVEGRKGAWKVPLQCAGYAMLAREDDAALELYERAFSDPPFADVARESSTYRMLLVTAANVAMRAKRPNDALRWLRAAEIAARGPIPGTEGLRVQIDEALRGNPSPWEKDEDEPAKQVAPSTKAPSGPTVGIGLAPKADGGGAQGAPEPAPSPADSSPPIPTIVGVAALAVAVLAAAFFALRRERGGRRTGP